jgi:hypothetical protein
MPHRILRSNRGKGEAPFPRPAKRASQAASDPRHSSIWFLSYLCIGAQSLFAGLAGFPNQITQVVHRAVLNPLLKQIAFHAPLPP